VLRAHLAANNAQKLYAKTRPVCDRDVIVFVFGDDGCV
jgi:hypothetical protein